MTRARFRGRISGRFDGAAGATVTISSSGGELLFSVRPLRRRRSYELPLVAVARGVLYDVVRTELRRSLAAAKRGRR